jgi:hypothetical protein
MKLEQKQWKGTWGPSATATLGERANLVLVFGETELLKQGKVLEELKAMYPKAHQFGCSTSGEVYGTTIYDDTVSSLAIEFEGTRVAHASASLKGEANSYDVGRSLTQKLDHEGLAHVLVLSTGLNINGAELVRGLTSGLPQGVTVTGGLAGDKERFKETLIIAGGEVMLNDAVAVVGLYGKQIQVGYASLGGWDPFGPERRITKSKSNVIYEIDGKSALNLYKSYLGKYAAELPASAQYFPLSVKMNPEDPAIVRTIITVDEANQSMISGGDLPEGSIVRMMKTNLDRLIEGAKGAAEKSTAEKPQFALMISCVGRRMVLKQRADEELEKAREVYGADTLLTGFYSYGEISPFTPNAKCELHNQTMTITTFSESVERA